LKVYNPNLWHIAFSEDSKYTKKDLFINPNPVSRGAYTAKYSGVLLGYNEPPRDVFVKSPYGRTHSSMKIGLDYMQNLFECVYENKDDQNTIKVLRKLNDCISIGSEKLLIDKARMFKREIEIMLKLYHGNIVRAVTSVSINKLPCLVSRYIWGWNIFEKRNNMKRPLNLKESLWILIGVSQGLSYLHNSLWDEGKIAHDDLHGGNVMMDADGNVIITDFGLHKKLHSEGHDSQVFSATSEYLFGEEINNLRKAPEFFCATSGFTSTTCDVWEAGNIFWESLTGENTEIEIFPNKGNKHFNRIEQQNIFTPDKPDEEEVYKKNVNIGSLKRPLGQVIEAEIFPTEPFIIQTPGKINEDAINCIKDKLHINLEKQGYDELLISQISEYIFTNLIAPLKSPEGLNLRAIDGDEIIFSLKKRKKDAEELFETSEINDVSKNSFNEIIRETFDSWEKYYLANEMFTHNISKIFKVNDWGSVNHLKSENPDNYGKAIDCLHSALVYCRQAIDLRKSPPNNKCEADFLYTFIKQICSVVVDFYNMLINDLLDDKNICAEKFVDVIQKAYIKSMKLVIDIYLNGVETDENKKQKNDISNMLSGLLEGKYYIENQIIRDKSTSDILYTTKYVEDTAKKLCNSQMLTVLLENIFKDEFTTAISKVRKSKVINSSFNDLWTEIQKIRNIDKANECQLALIYMVGTADIIGLLLYNVAFEILEQKVYPLLGESPEYLTMYCNTLNSYIQVCWKCGFKADSFDVRLLKLSLEKIFEYWKKTHIFDFADNFKNIVLNLERSLNNETTKDFFATFMTEPDFKELMETIGNFSKISASDLNKEYVTHLNVEMEDYNIKKKDILSEKLHIAAVDFRGNIVEDFMGKIKLRIDQPVYIVREKEFVKNRNIILGTLNKKNRKQNNRLCREYKYNFVKKDGGTLNLIIIYKELLCKNKPPNVDIEWIQEEPKKIAPGNTESRIINDIERINIKISNITENIYLNPAGSGADTAYFENELKKAFEIKRQLDVILHDVRNEEADKILKMDKIISSRGLSGKYVKIMDQIKNISDKQVKLHNIGSIYIERPINLKIKMTEKCKFETINRLNNEINYLKANTDKNTVVEANYKKIALIKSEIERITNLPEGAEIDLGQTTSKIKLSVGDNMQEKIGTIKTFVIDDEHIYEKIVNRHLQGE
jgi:serine/threonine protein kinase